MSTEPWEFFCTRLHGDGTETFLEGDLPFAPEVTKVLSGADTIAGTITPEIANLRVGGEIALVPWSTALYATYNGAIAAGTIVQGISGEGPNLSIDAAGFSDYPRGQGYDGMSRFVETDALDVVRHIWAHLQSQPNGNLGLVLDTRKSGVLVGQRLEDVELETGLGEDIYYETGPLQLAWWMTDDLGKEITDLAESTPFDYAERHSWGGTDRINHRLDFGAPTLGRRRHDLHLVEGENVLVAPAVTRDGGEYASEVWFLGSGEGSSMIRGNASRRNPRLRRVAIATDKQIRTKRLATTKAQGELDWRTGGDDISDVTLVDWTGDIPDLGDEILIQGGGTGWFGDINLWVRVLSMTRGPSHGGRINLSVTRADRLVP